VLNGGENHADNPDEYFTADTPITLKDPSRTGYVFDGWAEGNSIAAGSTGDKTFTAQWKYTEANVEEISINGVSIADNADDGVFEYVSACGQSSITLALEVSPEASVKIDGTPYSSSGHTIAITEVVADVTISVTSEAGATEDYTLKIVPPVSSDKLYYQRWSDVIAINRNPATNGGVNIADIRWHKQDGSTVTTEAEDYIHISSGSQSDYYAEIQTGGEWRRVCNTATKSSDKIVAYPNPVLRGENLTLQLPESFAGSMLNIYSVAGRLVKSGLSLPTTSNSIDLSEYVPGIYLLHIIDAKGNTQVVNIVIE
jgi:uncharacterized repeat protein (TIGR02543 family)